MQYDVVFHGEFSPEYDIDEAKEKLAKIFKLKPETVDTLFAGQSVTIRKNVDAVTAQKYQKAAAGCGVIFELEPRENPAETTTTPAAMAARDATMVICPNCSFSQSRSTTCLQCGDFLIKPAETPRPARITAVSVPVSTAENALGSSKNLWKTARISLLLLVLFIVGMNTFMTGRWTTDWDEPLWVGIYPINGDQKAHISNFIDRDRKSVV